MKKVRLAILSCAWLAVLIFFAGCGGGGPRSPRNQPIRIGVSLPLTGDSAVWGKSQKNGYDLAAEQVNAEGGIHGRRIELIYGDDQGLARVGVTVLQRFIDVDKIEALTGVANSSVALADIPIINRNKVLLISSGASSPKLTGASKYFFRTWPSDIAEALAMAKFAAEVSHVKTVSCLYINNDYGVGLVMPFAKRFSELGGKILDEEAFEQGATDLRAQLTKIKEQDPGAIYLAGNPPEMGRAITQARQLGVTNRFLSISTLNDASVLAFVKKSDIEGTIITDASFDPSSGWPEARKFMLDFRAKYHREPGILANTAYDALMILSKAIGKVGTNADALSHYLHSMKAYHGVAGTIDFTTGGDIDRPIRISVAKNGRFEVIEHDYRE